jgi:hypothetical protein
VTVPGNPSDVRALFDEAELAEIASRSVNLTGQRTIDAVELASGWANRVAKIDLDRALPWSDRSVWNEHDLAGSLFARDFLQEAIDGLPQPLRDRLAGWVAGVDERFRSYTVDDPRERMAKVAETDLAGRGWWWRRVPATGPIAEDLARY